MYIYVCRKRHSKSLYYYPIINHQTLALSAYQPYTALQASFLFCDHECPSWFYFKIHFAELKVRHSFTVCLIQKSQVGQLNVKRR